MGSGQSIEDHLFNLRLTAKQLAKEAKNSEKSSVANKDKCKTAMEKGNMDGARIYAESAIRDKNTALNYLRLSSRIDAVSQRVNTAVKMKSLTKDMSGIVSSMDSVMKTMNVEKISAVMDKFEKQFEDLDLTTGVMEQSMAQSTAQAMPESQVESLMAQVADEHGLEFEAGIPGLPQSMVKPTEKKEEEKKETVVGISGGGTASVGGKKKGGDSGAAGGNNNGGGGSGGGVVNSGGSSSKEDESLEDRLRRLQGL